MNIFAIITEYNPMHNGHIYQINSIKKRFPDSMIIILMSGSFVQRGEPSFINKYSRAFAAVNNGVDLVLEIPTIISLQSANYFTKYSIKLLNKLNILSFLSFGIEESDISGFLNSFDLYWENRHAISKIQKEYILKGNSYKVSFNKALSEFVKNSQSLSNPNNTLGFGYLKALREFDSDIIPLPVTRIDDGYHKKNISENIFQSATAIRTAVENSLDVSGFVPPDINISLKNDFLHSIDDYSSIFYQLAFVDNKAAENIAGYENGMLNLLKSNFSLNLSDMVEKSHNKRYSISRLRRFLMNYILDIDWEKISLLDFINYIRPIAFNDNGAKILNLIKNKSDVEIINKPRDITKLDESNRKLFELDLKAYRLYNLKTPVENQRDFTNNPYNRLELQKGE